MGPLKPGSNTPTSALTHHAVLKARQAPECTWSLALDNHECPVYELSLVKAPIGYPTGYVPLMGLVYAQNSTSYAALAKIPQVFALPTRSP